jgi:hypothetical protein
MSSSAACVQAAAQATISLVPISHWVVAATDLEQRATPAHIQDGDASFAITEDGASSATKDAPPFIPLHDMDDNPPDPKSFAALSACTPEESNLASLDSNLDKTGGTQKALA